MYARISTIDRVYGTLRLAAKRAPRLDIQIESYEMAQQQWIAYRDKHNLSASDMKPRCGEIENNQGVLVARISYNGRIWDWQDKLILDY